MTTPKRIVGCGSKQGFHASFPPGTETWKNDSPTCLEISAADQTATVDVGFTVAELQEQLGRQGQCLPLPEATSHGRLLAGLPGTIGGLLAMNVPHGLSAQHGGPREWLLQAEVMFRGEPAKAGAKVVKSVAGYDVHKVFVGSRGVLGPIVRVTLRTWPVRAVLDSGAIQSKEWNGEDVWILRTLPSDFERCLAETQGLFASDRPSCTLWAGVRPNPPVEGWMIGPRGEIWRDNATPELDKRLKDVFDPVGEWV